MPGNISYDQIRDTHRQGSGDKIQMFSGEYPAAPGDTCGYDEQGNVVSIGVTVASFQGRTGDVTPQPGDYAAEDITSGVFDPERLGGVPQVTPYATTRDLFLRADQIWAVPPGANGQPQTPWLSNIDGGGFTLFDTAEVITQILNVSNYAQCRIVNLPSLTDPTAVWSLSGDVNKFYCKLTNSGAQVGDFHFMINSNYWMYVAHNCKIGIGGNVNPQYALDVTGDVNVTGAFRVNGTPLSAGGAVSSVFGRSGAVVAASGDYTAAQVTNAVSTANTYADPPWITSLAYSKITGAPAAASQTPWTQDINAAGFRLLNTGNVGIATANPLANLNVIGSTGIRIAASVYDNENSIAYKISRNGSTGLLDFVGEQTGYIGYTFNGKVGINTTSPIAPLDFGATVADQKILLYSSGFSRYGMGLISGGEFRSFVQSGALGFTWGSISVADGASFTETMRLTAGGNLGIGAANAALRLVVASGVDGPPSPGTAGGAASFHGSGGNVWGLYIGTINTGACWLQCTRQDGNGSVYPLSLNPAGGGVSIGHTNSDRALSVIQVNTSSPTQTQIVVREQTYNTAYGGFLGFITANGVWATSLQSWVGGAGGNLHLNVLGGAVGINKGAANPAYALDITGDCNVTGSFRVGGVAIPTSSSAVTTKDTTVITIGTVYQNTTGKPMFVHYTGTVGVGSSANLITDTSASPTTIASSVSNGGSSNQWMNVSGWILPAHYYKVTGFASGNQCNRWW